MAGELFITFALVAANGFFVASEFAIARLRLTEAIEMERAGRPGARSALHAVEHIDVEVCATDETRITRLRFEPRAP